MDERIRGTWLPTVVFAALAFALHAVFAGSGPLLQFGPTLTALVVVPLAWHPYVTRSGGRHVERAMLSGAASALLIPTCVYVARSMVLAVTRRGGSHEFDGILDLFVIGGGVLLAAPAGALLGVFLALIDHSWLRKNAEPVEASVRRTQATVRGALVAIVLSPFLAFFAALVLEEPLRLLRPRVAIGFSAMIGLTWLSSVPPAAILGARRSSSAEETRRRPKDGSSPHEASSASSS